MHLQIHTRNYRKSKIVEIRRRRFYFGHLHYGFTMISTGTIATFSMYQIDKSESVNYYLVFMIIIYSNFIEYFTHKYLLHKRLKWLNILYERHARQHHSYFTDTNISIQSHHELYYVLFPIAALFVFIPLVAIPMSYSIALTFGKVNGWASLATMSLYFAWYESFHLANHLPRNHWIHHISFVRSLCAFHRNHHRPEWSMKYNFNVTFPFADMVFRTLRK